MRGKGHETSSAFAVSECVPWTGGFSRKKKDGTRRSSRVRRSFRSRASMVVDPSAWERPKGRNGHDPYFHKESNAPIPQESYKALMTIAFNWYHT